jgi:hypothetical protein
MTRASGRRNFSPLEQAVVEGYLSQIAQAGGPNHWSWTILNELLEKAPERAWPLLVEIVRRAPDSGLNEIGAGPLEDLLGYNGPKVISKVEAQAAEDPRFRLALAGVWQGMMSREIFERVQAAAPPSLTDGLEDDPRYHSAFMTRRLEVSIAGRPPSRALPPATRRDAMDRLVAAVASRPPMVVLPFRGPVIIDLRLELSPGSEPVDPTRLLFDVAQALTRRKVRAITDARQIRRIDYWQGAAREDRYNLQVIEMSDDEAAATEDPRDLEEVMRSIVDSDTLQLADAALVARKPLT